MQLRPETERAAAAYWKARNAFLRGEPHLFRGARGEPVSATCRRNVRTKDRYIVEEDLTSGRQVIHLVWNLHHAVEFYQALPKS